jgi:hypothetical protein
MSEVEPQKVRKITLGLVLGWIVGLALLLLGAVNIASHPAGVIVLFIAALIALPPVSKLMAEKLKFSLSGVLKFFIVIILMGVGIALSPAAPSDQPAAVSSGAAKQYQQVYTFSGNGAKKSEPFTVAGDRFKIAYNCQGQAAATLCQAFVFKVGSPFPQAIMNSPQSVSDETVIYTSLAGTGEYYIDANVLGSFSMTVYDYR